MEGLIFSVGNKRPAFSLVLNLKRQMHQWTSLSSFTIQHPSFLFTEHCCIQQHRTRELRTPEWIQLPCGQVTLSGLLPLLTLLFL